MTKLQANTKRIRPEIESSVRYSREKNQGETKIRDESPLLNYCELATSTELV